MLVGLPPRFLVVRLFFAGWFGVGDFVGVEVDPALEAGQLAPLNLTFHTFILRNI